MSAETSGINHLGLTVADLRAAADFFVSVLGWDESGFDPSYPRTAVTDGTCRVTLWQAKTAEPKPFDRHGALGLHHLALQVESEARLNALADKIAAWPGVAVEFMPELMGKGPRKHMMFLMPGGPRLELTWPGPGA